MVKNVIMVGLLCGVLSIDCADQEQQKESKQSEHKKKSKKITKIYKWDDVAPFAGSIVLYSAEDDYFTAGEGAYLLDAAHPKARVGYIKEQVGIWDKPNGGSEEGYEMVRLLKPSQKQSICVLSDSMIAKNPHKYLKMRKAKSEEKKMIRKAAGHGQAEFEQGSSLVVKLTKALK